MKTHPRFLIVIAMSLIALMSSDAADAPAQSKLKPDVLMIVIDDLNDWISILGHPKC